MLVETFKEIQNYVIQTYYQLYYSYYKRKRMQLKSK